MLQIPFIIIFFWLITYAIYIHTSKITCVLQCFLPLLNKPIVVKKKVFDYLLGASGASNEDTYSYYVEYVSKGMMNKLRDLYDMYTKINQSQNKCNRDNECKLLKECASLYLKYKKTCESNNDRDFCYALDDFKNYYNTQIKIISYGKFENHMLPSFQKYNISIFIIIPIVVILVISNSLFYVSKVNYDFFYSYICYKKKIFFTKHDSWIRLLIKRIKNKFNNIDEMWDSLQPYEASSDTSSNIRYNILYNKE
ncbi:variable surface protein [Plasmodium gonderi]|uniref:Variable surface protein n=1 Tax=Plasmodium gonderi TaxID=77519 RepID=A0A1Y1JR91_PLAGO|nr:variable surface protein [Plasmodium gonderi]GAW84015.1 variable surface protein [Plasmodium gonderi]